MISAKSLLRIDADRVVRAVQDYVREITTQHSASGVLLGLSGGLDSAVLATLAVRSLGRESVHGAYLYDRDSTEELAVRARLVADWLGLKLEARDIEPAMRERGVYAPLVVRLSSGSRLLNRFLHRSHHFLFRETPFVSSLRIAHANPSDREPRLSGLRRTVCDIEAAFNARHIHRRELLELEAATRDWLLLGAANGTEWSVGWFVKGGVDAVPLQPLKGLYKTQVRQLATFLGIPEAIVRQAPSPDMMKGITDEFAMGMSYSEIDVALDHLDGGVSAEEVVDAGVSEKQLRMVSELKRLSAWKREPPGSPAPVDGGPAGGFRA